MSYTKRTKDREQSSLYVRRRTRAEIFVQAFDFVQALQRSRVVSFAASSRKDLSMPALVKRLRKRARPPTLEEYIMLLPHRIFENPTLFDEAIVVFLQHFHQACREPAIESSLLPAQDSCSFHIVDIPQGLQDFQPFLLLCVAVAREKQWHQTSGRAVLEFLRQENLLTGNLRTSTDRLNQQYVQPFAKLTPDDLFRIISADVSTQLQPERATPGKSAEKHVGLVTSIDRASIHPKAKAGLMSIAQQLGAGTVADLYVLLAERFPKSQELLAFLTAQGVINEPYPREWLDIRQKLPAPAV